MSTFIQILVALQPLFLLICIVCLFYVVWKSRW